MSKGRHTEAEIIAALEQVEAGRKAEDVAREVGVSKHTISRHSRVQASTMFSARIAQRSAQE